MCDPFPPDPAPLLHSSNASRSMQFFEDRRRSSSTNHAFLSSSPLPSRSSFFLARLPPDLRGGSNNFRRFYLPGISPRSRTTVVNPRRDVTRLRSPLVLSPPRHLFFIFLLSDPRRDDARSLFAKQPTVFLLRCANRYATTRTTFLQYVRTYVHTDIYPAAMSRVSAICTDR